LSRGAAAVHHVTRHVSGSDTSPLLFGLPNAGASCEADFGFSKHVAECEGGHVIPSLHALLNLQPECLPKPGGAEGEMHVPVHQERGGLPSRCPIVNPRTDDEGRVNRVLAAEAQACVRGTRGVEPSYRSYQRDALHFVSGNDASEAAIIADEDMPTH
jgi:hypothetical protein